MVDVNLIPEVVRIAKARRRHSTRWVLSTLATGAVLATAAGLDWLDRAEAGRLRAESEQLQVDLVQERRELRSSTAQVEQLRLQIERARALQTKRAWSGLIALLGDCMPDGCWLTAIATDPARPAGGPVRARSPDQRPDTTKEGAVIIDAPRKLEISGYAPQAAQPYDFVSALKETRVFSNAVLRRSQREPILDGPYYRFELVCEW